MRLPEIVHLLNHTRLPEPKTYLLLLSPVLLCSGMLAGDALAQLPPAPMMPRSIEFPTPTPGTGSMPNAYMPSNQVVAPEPRQQFAPRYGERAVQKYVPEGPGYTPARQYQSINSGLPLVNTHMNRGNEYNPRNLGDDYYGYHAPGGYEPRVGSPYFYDSGLGPGGVSIYTAGGDPYSYHFGPGYYRNREHGHYRFPYYSYRRPWYHPGFASFNRDTNLPW